MRIGMEWAGQSSVDHRATVLLRHEHELLLELFRRQRAAEADPAERNGLQQRIEALLDLMGRVEREVLFPALPAQYAALVHAFTAGHAALSGCVLGMQHGLDASTISLQQEKLEQLARVQVTQEETLLYDAVERDEPALNLALYERLVAARRALVASDAGRAPH